MTPTHVYGCTGKKKYGTRSIPDQMAAGGGRKGKRLYVYQCVHCRCWHLTGMSQDQHELGIRKHNARGVHIPERAR